MPLIVAIILGIVVIAVVVKLALGLIVLAIGLALAVFVYFAAEKLVGKGQ